MLTKLDLLDQRAANSSDPMTFYRHVAEVAVATKDEHVISYPPKAYRASRRKGRMMLPYTVRWIDNEPYLASIADTDFDHFIGSKIVSLDDRSSQEVFDTLQSTISADGLSETFAIRRLEDFTPTQNENYFDLNYPIWFEERARYSLTVETPLGEVNTIELDALDWVAFSKFYRQRLKRTRPIQFRWLDDHTAYLSVLSFHDWYFDEHNTNASSELNAIFEEIHQKPDTKLILDLRQNEGGGDISSSLLDYLMVHPFKEYDRVLTKFVGQPPAARHCDNAEDVAFDPSWSEPSSDGLFELRDTYKYLIKGANERTPNPNPFEGPLVVLISGATGSAAAKVAAVLDREGRAQFVGEETGGAAAGATAFGYCSLVLPNSGISVDIPLVRFERKTASPYGRGVLPDVTVDTGRIPPVTSSDTVLAAAIRMLGAHDGDTR